MFDGINYFKRLALQNKLVIDNSYHVAECSGLEAIEPILDNFQTKTNFLLVDDTVDAELVSNNSGFFNRRVFTVAIIAKHRWNDTADRNEKMNVCREVFRQFLSKLIIDKENYQYGDSLVYMRTEIIKYREMNVYNLGNATGVVFMLPVDEPTDLRYDANDWE